MKKIFALLLMCFCLLAVMAQQQAQFTHYMYNSMLYNPAAAGALEQSSFTILARQQWIGFNSSSDHAENPRTNVFSADMPVRILHGGLGVSVYQDELGFDKNLGINLDYAYRFNLGPGNLAIGLQAIILNKKRDFSKFEVLESDDPVFRNKTVQTVMINDMGVGLFFQIPEAFQIGLSSSQLLESSAAMQGSSITKLKRHYYLFSDYQYKLPSFTDWSLRPSVFAESDGTATQFSTSLLLENSRHYWIGLAYRNQDAVSVLAGLHYKGLRIAYAYDWTTSSMKKAGSMGSHEIMLNYFIKIERMPARTMYKNARYL